MSPLILYGLPLINALVTGAFAGTIILQYVRRHRWHQFFWSLALTMAFGATLAYIFMLVSGPTSAAGQAFFRVYYVFGAAVMPSWLGLGCLALVVSPRTIWASTFWLTLASCIVTILITISPLDLTHLAAVAGTSGANILVYGPWLLFIIALNTIGVLLIAGTALYSGWKFWKKQRINGQNSSLNVLWANLLIFAGAILNAASGSISRVFQFENSFWIVMTLGWIVLYSGVLLIGRRPRIAQSATQSA